MTGEALPDPALGEAPPFVVSLASGPSWWRSTAKWILGALLVLDLTALLFALSLAHVTAEGPAKRSLAQSVAILTEIDAYLDDHSETLQQEADETERATFPLPDYAIPVSVTPDEVLEGDREELRALVLRRSADLVYDDGMSVFQEEQGTGVSFLSLQGAVRNGMDFLRPTPHRVLTAVTIALAAGGGLLTLGLVLSCRGYGRLVGPGVSLCLAAVPFLILAIAVRFALRQAADGLDEYLAREFLELGQELTWAPIRDGMIFSVGGGVFLVLGAVLAFWSDRLRGS